MNCRAKILAVSLALAAAGPSFAGDVEAGKKTFVKCSVCHTLEKDVSKIGPSLHGVFGRKAGTLASYALYSEAMKNSGVVWSEETIRELVKAPRTYIKGTRMIFLGLRDDEEIAGLLAYIKSAASPPASAPAAAPAQ